MCLAPTPCVATLAPNTVRICPLGGKGSVDCKGADRRCEGEEAGIADWRHPSTMGDGLRSSIGASGSRGWEKVGVFDGLLLVITHSTKRCPVFFAPLRQAPTLPSALATRCHSRAPTPFALCFHRPYTTTVTSANTSSGSSSKISERTPNRLFNKVANSVAGTMIVAVCLSSRYAVVDPPSPPQLGWPYDVDLVSEEKRDDTTPVGWLKTAEAAAPVQEGAVWHLGTRTTEGVAGPTAGGQTAGGDSTAAAIAGLPAGVGSSAVVICLMAGGGSTIRARGHLIGVAPGLTVGSAASASAMTAEDKFMASGGGSVAAGAAGREDLTADGGSTMAVPWLPVGGNFISGILTAAGAVMTSGSVLAVEGAADRTSHGGSTAAVPGLAASGDLTGFKDVRIHLLTILAVASTVERLTTASTSAEASPITRLRAAIQFTSRQKHAAAAPRGVAAERGTTVAAAERIACAASVGPAGSGAAAVAYRAAGSVGTGGAGLSVAASVGRACRQQS